ENEVVRVGGGGRSAVHGRAARRRCGTHHVQWGERIGTAVFNDVHEEQAARAAVALHVDRVGSTIDVLSVEDLRPVGRSGAVPVHRADGARIGVAVRIRDRHGLGDGVPGDYHHDEVTSHIGIV